MKFINQLFKGWRGTEVAWLSFSLLSIISLSVYSGDTTLGIIAATTGMMYTFLAGKGKTSCFLFGLINTPIYAYLAFKSGYYGDAALNLYYFAMMFPSLVIWLKNSAQDPEEGIIRTRLSAKGRIILAFLCIACAIPLWGILYALNGARPLCDSLTNILSIAAMILTARRAIEQWILWIAVDAIEVFMWYKSWLNGEGHISILLMWLLFLANGIYLLSLWMRIEKRRTLKTTGNPDPT
jgi:nicotinamide mononucleotide transporter